MHTTSFSRITISIAFLVAVAIAAPAQAGIFDDLRDTIKGVNDTIQDAQDTVDEAEATVEDARDLVPDTTWFANIRGSNQELTGEQLNERIESGRLSRKTLVWTEGMSDWQPAGSVPSLQSAFAKAPPEQPRVSSPPPLPRKGPPPMPSRSDSLEDQL